MHKCTHTPLTARPPFLHSPPCTQATRSPARSHLSINYTSGYHGVYCCSRACRGARAASPLALAHQTPPFLSQGRMHSNGKGISDSALPYKRTPPSWLKETAAQVVDSGEWTVRAGSERLAARAGAHGARRARSGRCTWRFDLIRSCDVRGRPRASRGVSSTRPALQFASWRARASRPPRSASASVIATASRR
jgi:hypothetical protein